MTLRKSLITASIAAAFALGAMGQAQASVYAGAFLEIDNLIISTTGVGDPAIPINYVFDLRNTATLNGTNAIETATCQGGILPTYVTTCNTTGNVLDAAPAQVGTTQADNTFSYLGPNGLEYARSDSVIYDAELVTTNPSHTANIAESELQTGTSAASSSEIQSNTGLTFVFDVSGPGTVSIEFDANVDLLAEINDTDALIASAQASTSFQVLISQDNTGNSVTWNPNTVSAAGSACVDGTQSGTTITCTEQEVAEDLNNNVGVNTTPFSQDAYSRAPDANPGFGSYFASFSFTEAGRYTLTLAEQKIVQVSRIPAQNPEPSTLLLLSAGLLGMGIARRRVTKA